MTSYDSGHGSQLGGAGLARIVIPTPVIAGDMIIMASWTQAATPVQDIRWVHGRATENGIKTGCDFREMKCRTERPGSVLSHRPRWQRTIGP